MGSLRAADGTRLAFDDDGSGEPIVVLHGLGSSRARWKGTAGALIPFAAGERIHRTIAGSRFLRAIGCSLGP
jgi:pimeloyl-ACP methyl ester carboxylesterase